MAEDFLEYVDDIHKTYREKNNISNKYFTHYIPLRSITIPAKEKFYIAKGMKSRVLINHNAVWVDLTDYDMIDIICGLDDGTALKLLEELKKCYNGIWTDFEFKVRKEIYTGKGIDYRVFNLKKKIYLEADFEICFGDFLFIMNMILFKDIVGQKYLLKKSKLLLIEKTLIKYITLVKYYKFQDSRAQNYLKRIKYPIYDRKKLLDHKMTAVIFDERFRKNGFEKKVLL